MPRGRRKWGRRYAWARLDHRDLLDLRMSDLGLRIEGTWLQTCIERVIDELAQRGLRFAPHFWLSDEWFSPAEVPGVALPFYLAHPRLMKLERSRMLHVEGGTVASCMQYLRHEVGHAILHAYRLNRRRRWQRSFGSSTTPYPQAYRPNPVSRRFVHHLPGWYAQSHPEEDFAETFAVWLRPRASWRRRYQGWPALKKLDTVDALMEELTGRVRKQRHSRARPYNLPSLHITLREYYEKKRAHYRPGFTDAYDRDLRRIFDGQDAAGEPLTRKRPPSIGLTAAQFLRRNRREIRRLVARWSRGYEFTIDAVLNQMIGRCSELKLMARGSERQLMLDFAVLLTVHGMTYLYRGRESHAM
jgi:hypothetical protein